MLLKSQHKPGVMLVGLTSDYTISAPGNIIVASRGDLRVDLAEVLQGDVEDIQQILTRRPDISLVFESTLGKRFRLSAEKVVMNFSR